MSSSVAVANAAAAANGQPVFLSIDMDPAEAQAHFLAGRCTPEAYFGWVESKLAAAKVAAAKAAAGGVRVTFEGAAGVVCLSGANRAAGVKGFDPNFKPAVWAIVLDNAAAVAQTILDHAADVHPEDATRKTLNAEWQKWNKGGKKGAEPKPKFIEEKHPRAGKSAMEFSSEAEKQMVLGKCQAFIERLAAGK